MRLAPAFAALALLAGCAGTAPAPGPEAAAAPAAAEVRRDGEEWTAEFRFGRAAPVWLFAHSSVTREGNRPWRPGSWTVETPGVRLVRLGRHDALVAEGGDVPRRVRIRFVPFTEGLAAEYVPALAFTDGSVALWSGHFHLIPLGSRAAAEALPLDLNGLDLPGGGEVAFRDAAGPVLHGGRRWGSATLAGGKTYVLFGPAEPIVTDDIATVIDPALPRWLAREIGAFTPAVLARFADALGPRPGPKPMLLVSWAGATPGKTSMGGSTLDGQVAIAFEGEGVLAETAGLRDHARWFIAHEAAHFWLGQTVTYEAARDAWITEGGADLLAVRALAAMDPAYDPRPFLQRSLDECIALADDPVAAAHERGEHRAFYACGALFALAAERIAGTDFLRWTRARIDENRADGILTRAEWLAALGDEATAARIAALLDGTAGDPKRALAALLAGAGIPHRIGADGAPDLL